jgi:hypothetical protein
LVSFFIITIPISDENIRIIAMSQTNPYLQDLLVAL